MVTLLRALERPLVEAIGWSLLHFVWQGLIVAALSAVGLTLLRRFSSHVRYFFLCGGMGVMAICPIVTWYAVVASLQPDPLSSLSESDALSAAEIAEAHAAKRLSNSQVVQPDPSQMGLMADSAFQPNPLGFGPSSVLAPDTSISPTSTSEAPAEGRSWQGQLRGWMSVISPWLVGAWFSGVVFLSVHLLLGWRAIQRIKRLASTPASNLWQERLKRLAGRLKVSRTVQLVESTMVAVPTVIGWLRPMILLPTTVLTGLEPSQLEALLAHELAHIRRNDFVVNLIQTAVETLLFYHPAIWWLSRRIRDEREHCCDDMAVEVCGNNVIYARALATMEELRGRPKLTMAADGGSLLGRIRRLVCPAPDVRRSTWGASVIAITTILVLAIGAYLGTNTNANALAEAKTDSPAPEKFIAKLPDSIEVEIVGVGFHPSKDREWWKPDGSVLEKRPYQASGGSVMPGSPDQAKCREFSLEIRGLPKEHSVTINSGDGASATGSSYAKGIWNGEYAAGPFNVPTANIRIGIATGAFPAPQAIDLTGKKLKSPDLPADLTKLYDKVIPLKVIAPVGKTELVLNGAQLNELRKLAEFRILAIDLNKKTYRSNSSFAPPSGDLHLVFPIEHYEIVRFEFEVRPYRHWVTFENVTLEPGEKAEVLIKTESTSAEKKPDAQPPETPEATRAQELLKAKLVADISAASEKLSSGRLHTEFEKFMDMSWFSNKKDVPPSKTQGTVDWIGDGRLWRIDYSGQLPDATNPTPSIDKWSTGFDGKQHFHANLDRNQLAIGRAKGDATQYTPANFFWDPAGHGIGSILAAISRTDTKITVDTLEGMTGYRAENTVKKDGVWRWSTFICPERGFLPLHTQNFHDDRLTWECKLSDLREVQRGVWYPQTLLYGSYSWDKNDQRKIFWQYDYKVTKFELNAPGSINPLEFQARPAFGTKIGNLIEGISYQNDVWWSDLSPILRQKLDWPKASFAHLKQARSNLSKPVAEIALPDLNIQQQTPLEAGQTQPHRVVWLNSKPLDWKQLAGKVTLIVFWHQIDDRSVEVVSSLRRLHEMYSSHGLQIVAVHLQEQEIVVRPLVDELNLPFPVALDTEGVSGNGALYDAFATRGLPSTVFVDHQLKIQPIVDDHPFAEQLVNLLKANGAVNPPSIELEDLTSGETTNAIRAIWLEQISKAPKTASIVGQLVDAQNKPIANAQIEALLAFHMLYGAYDFGAYGVLPDFKGKQVVQTDANGRFALPNLIKGQYTLAITAAGKAVQKQDVALVEGEAQTVDLQLNFSDFISGKVVANGEPVANVKVNVRWRHEDPTNLGRHTSSPGNMPATVTNADGNFRFEKLTLGRYTIDFTADGFNPGVAETVLLGRTDVEVKLQPAEPKTPVEDKATSVSPQAEPEKQAGQVATRDATQQTSQTTPGADQGANDAQPEKQTDTLVKTGPEPAAPEKNTEKIKAAPLEFRFAAPDQTAKEGETAWFPISAPPKPVPETERGMGLTVTKHDGDAWQALLWNSPKHALLWDGKWSITKSEVVPDPNEPSKRFSVNVTLDEAGATAFKKLTSGHLNQRLAIVVDGTIISAPVVRAEIGANVLVTGNFSKSDAEKLDAAFRKGIKPKAGQGSTIQPDPVTALKRQLASSDQKTRDAAAAMLRNLAPVVVPNPKPGKLLSLEPQIKRDVALKFAGLNEEDVEAKLDQFEVFRLDDQQIARVWFDRQTGNYLKSELIPQVRSVWVEPPADYTGVWTTYFVNGNRRYQISYQSGKYDGPYLAYYDNGKVAVSQQYSMQICDGEDIGYYPSGEVLHLGNYAADRQVGLWTFYYPNGSVRTTQKYPDARPLNAVSSRVPKEKPASIKSQSQTIPGNPGQTVIQASSKSEAGVASPGPLDFIAKLDAVDKPLAKAILDIARQGNLQVEFDKGGLDEAKADKMKEVSLTISGVKARSILSLLLHPQKLGYYLDQNTIYITSEERLNRGLYLRSYSLVDILAQQEFKQAQIDATEFASIVRQTIQPRSWDNINKGVNSLSINVDEPSQQLLVRQTRLGHIEIGQLLHELSSTSQSVPSPEMRKLLKQPVTLDFQDIKFTEAVSRLQTYLGGNLRRDPEGLVENDSTITLHSKDRPLHQALKSILDPQKATYRVRDEIVVIGAKSRLESRWATHLYPITVDPANIIKAIESKVAAASWEKSSGPGRIRQFGKLPLLVIYQSELAHAEIADLLLDEETAQASVRQSDGVISYTVCSFRSAMGIGF
jgi:beta-lactamase regulating signal transducer with metallopeptidase domain/uncharacterized GH25 family protein